MKSILILILSSYVSSSHPRHLLSSEFDVSWTDGGAISSPAKTIYMAAVFHYNNKLFVFGDYTNKQSLFEYDISSEQFTDFGTSTLAYEIAGYSQFWTQIGNIGYIIGHYSTNQKNLYIYDLSTTNTPTLTTTLTIRNNTAGSEACLASGNNMLFVVGGVDPACSPDPTCEAIDSDLRIVQIYDLSSQQWLPNGPSMKWQRDEFACIVINDYLYAFGGFSWYDHQQWPRYGGLTDKIEKIQITDIFNNAWAYTPPYELLIKIRKHRAVIFGDYIVVIGGQSYDVDLDTYPAVDKIQLINTVSGVVSYAGGTLNKAVYSTTPILINNIIYAFGGIGATGGLNTWQYIALASDAPTSDPTGNPSPAPTNQPTPTPTNNPTSEPTATPTNIPTSPPTMAPSPAPTQNPTPAPTVNPTQDPTPSPTHEPTSAPTNNPTSEPTDVPTQHPIQDPTHSPTIQPTSEPTDTPTQNPTTGPITSSPTYEGETYNPTIYPTNNPTISPTNNPIQYTTQTPTTSTETETITTNNEPANNGGKNNQNLLNGLKSSLIILIVFVVVFALLFVIFLILWLRKRKEMQSIMTKNDSTDISTDTDYVQLTDDDDNNNL